MEVRGLRWVLLGLLFGGCAASTMRLESNPIMRGQPSVKAPHRNAAASTPAIGGKPAPELLFNFQQQKRLIVYTAEVTLEVLDIDEARGAVLRLAKEAGGYLTRETNTTITVRVPADKFHQTLEKVCKLGQVVERNISAQDVTEECLDIQLRLEALRKHLKRLEEVLQRTQNADEISRIMAQIKEVVVEIERLEGRLRVLKNQVAYSTLTVYLRRPVSRETAPAATPLPFEWVNLLSISRLFPD